MWLPATVEGYAGDLVKVILDDPPGKPYGRRVIQADAIRRDPRTDYSPAETRCTAYEHGCKEHGFIHGAEAEELREGIEDLIEEASGVAGKGRLVVAELRRLLDRVDARDSLAFREAKARAESKQKRSEE